MLKAFNTRNGKVLADSVTVADNLFARMKGLLGKKEMMQGEALWIKPCTSVHTFGMKFPIDVIFLNRKKMVAALVKNMERNRLTLLYLSAVSTLELPAGTIEKTETRVGDEIATSTRMSSLRAASGSARTTMVAKACRPWWNSMTSWSRTSMKVSAFRTTNVPPDR